MNYLAKAKNFRIKKRFGQNFLIDENVINRIKREANLSKDDTVLEIGAGVGFVTEQLAQSAKNVIAIEIDTDAIAELTKLPYDNVEILEQDILKTDISELFDKPLKVVANIPYYITSPILAHLLGEIDQPVCKNRQMVTEIILMVQYEVAKRIVATENSHSKDYGLLSILVNFWSEPEMIMKVPAKSFYPAPKVDSALVKLKIRQEPLIELNNPKFFRRVIQASFAQRRKNIKNSLINAGFYKDAVFKALEENNIDEGVRGETLSIKQFSDLADSLEKLQCEK
jgi:16S rRNA (adenine1518-N6/adenine1519-N6)-dimethyltransferase